MYLRDIITQLRTELPKSSDKFSEKLTISSITFLAGIVTVVTTTDHGLESGDTATIVDAKQKTQITTLTRVGTTVTMVTTTPHDQTKDYIDPSEQPPIVIGGSSIAAYNGSWAIESTDNRTTITFEITTTPADADDGYLEENSVGGYSGIKEVTVLDSTTFTFETDKSLTSEGIGGFVHTDIRVAGALDVELAKEAYTKQEPDNYWMFVVPIIASASKDRHTENDSTYSLVKGDDYRQKVIAPFEIYVFIPSTGDIAGRASYDSMVEESVGLYRSLLRFKLPTPYTNDTFNRIIFETHGPEEFVKPYYIHKFTFSVTEELMISDSNTTSEDVAFRDIDLKIQNTFDVTIMETSLETDEE